MRGLSFEVLDVVCLDVHRGRQAFIVIAFDICSACNVRRVRGVDIVLVSGIVTVRNSSPHRRKRVVPVSSLRVVVTVVSVEQGNARIVGGSSFGISVVDSLIGVPIGYEVLLLIFERCKGCDTHLICVMLSLLLISNRSDILI